MTVKKSGTQNPTKTKKRAKSEGASFDLSQLGDAILPSEGRMAVEPRVLLDAASTETADAVIDTVAAQQASDWAASQTDSDFDFDAGPMASEVESNDVYFIDGSLENIEDITSEIPPTAQIVILDTESDGVEQIAAYLDGQSDIDAVHIISHGEEGELVLGNATLDANTMRGEHQDELLAIKSVLTEEADILIYGCDFTGGAEGLEAAILLGSITGADIAASDDVTGHTELGGDWDLETNLGTVEAEGLAAEEWMGTLTTDTDNDGVNDDVDIDDDNDGILDINEGIDPAAVSGSFDNSWHYSYYGASPRTNDASIDQSFEGDGWTLVDKYFVRTNGDLPESTATFVNGITNVKVDDPGTPVESVKMTAWTTGTPSANDTVTIKSESAHDVTYVTITDQAGNVLADKGNAFATSAVTYDLTFDYPADGVVRIDVWVHDEGGYYNIPELTSAQTISSISPLATDTDGDRVADHRDLDSDNDGISDLYESNATDAAIAADTNNDGTISLAEAAAVASDGVADADGDGLMDIFDARKDNIAADKSKGSFTVDTDLDGLSDNLDLDSDNDRIADTIEARPTSNYVTNGGNLYGHDVDGDGIVDIFDSNDSSTGTFGGDHTLSAPVDTDGDGIADFRDTDSDNDSVLDISENGFTAAGFDANGNLLTATYANPDGSVGNPATALENALGDTSEVAYREAEDADGDGANDWIDPDDDNDGILDVDEGLVILDGLTAELAFTELGMARSVEGAGIYYFNLDGNAFSTYVDEFGYVQIALDSGDGDGSLTQGTALTNADRGILDVTTLGALTDISEVRFSHSGGIVDATTTNANIITRVQNNQTLKRSAADNSFNTEWIGTGANYLNVTGSSSSHGTALNDNIFHASGTNASFTWIPKADIQRAFWVGGEIADSETLSLWVRADAVETVTTVDSDGDNIADHLDLDSDNDGISDLVESGASQGQIIADANNDGSISVAEADWAVDEEIDGDGDPNSDGLMAVFEDDVYTVQGYIKGLNLTSNGSSFYNDANSAFSVTDTTEIVFYDDDGNFDGDPVNEQVTGTGTVAFGGKEYNYYADTQRTYTSGETDTDGNLKTYTFLIVDVDLEGDRYITNGSHPENGTIVIPVSEIPPNGTQLAQVAVVSGITYLQPNGTSAWSILSKANSVTRPLASGSIGAPRDTDGDGTADVLDLDSDNDGILDSVEGDLDTDGDGVANFRDLDSDNDGILDATEGVIDTDGDSIANYLDLDSDNDGIADTIEARTTHYYNGNDGDVTDDDADGDGIIDIFDTNNSIGGTHASLTAPVDTDGDGTADYLDTDSDNDGLLDSAESGLILSGYDLDGDGINDATNVSYSNPDGDVTNPSDDLANAIGTTHQVAYREIIDTDGDGVADTKDIDNDNDGILDINESNYVEGAPGITIATVLPTSLSIKDADNYALSNDGLEAIIDGSTATYLLNTGSETIDQLEFGFSESTNITEIVIHNNAGSNLTDNQSLELIGSIKLYDGNGNIVVQLDNVTVPEGGAGNPFTITLAETAFSVVRMEWTGIQGRSNGFAVRNVAVTAIEAVDGSVGSENHYDLDSDNDGITDLYESAATVTQLEADANNDGKISVTEAADANGGVADADGDGLFDIFDADVADISTAASVGIADLDTDGDNIANRLDLDSDNDSISDLVESGASQAQVDADADGDGSISLAESDKAVDGEIDGDGDPNSDGLMSIFEDNAYTVQGYVLGDSVTLDANTFYSSGDPEFTVTDSREIVFYDSDGNFDGDGSSISTNEQFLGTGTVAIDGQEYSYYVDYQQSYSSDVYESDGITPKIYEFLILDVDLDGSGSADRSNTNENGKVIIPMGEIPPNGTKLSGGGSLSHPDGTAAWSILSTVQSAEQPLVSGSIGALRDTDGDGVVDALDLDSDNDGILDSTEVVDHDGLTAVTAFTALGMADSVETAGIYHFNLGGNAFSTYVDASGYVQVAVDFGHGSGDLIQGTDLTNTTRGILDTATLAALTDTSEVRISHSGGDINATTTNSDIITRLQNNESLSHHVADNTINDDWVGTGADYLTGDASHNSGYGEQLHQNVFHAPGNAQTAVWSPSNGKHYTHYGDGGTEIGGTESLSLWVRADSVPTLVITDTDGDGVKDYLDLDSDNDGIADTIEARPTANYVTNDGDVTDDDSDGDGIIDIFDTNSTFGGDHANLSAPVDTDGDGIADFRDTDSEGDGLLDSAESGFTASGVDNNGDGIGDGSGASYANPDGGMDLSAGKTREINAPITGDDTDEVVNVAGQASSVAYGNVVTGSNAGIGGASDANTTDGAADDIGVDTTATPITGVVKGIGTPSTNVGSNVAGDYGILVINADGAYSYTPDYANTAVAGLGASDTLTDTFTYQITDGDGDSATATLIITLYGTPDVNDNTDGTVSGTDASVSEADLSTGSNASGTGEAVSSTFSIDTVKDLDKITVGGTEITTTELAASGTTPVDITTSKGTLSINGYDATSGAVSYTYTLSGNVTHTDGAPVSDDFTITVTDVLGDATTADLKIAIIDDTVSAGVDTGVVTEDATADVTGSVTTNDTIGADTNGSPVTGVIAGTVGAPTGNVDTAVSGTYGSLTLEANGNYTYTLDNSKPAVQALVKDATATDVFTYKITDGDGSSVTQTLTIEVTGINDAPVAVNDTASVNADATATGNVLTGSGVDTDVDGDVLTVTQINGATYSTGTAITLTSGATLTMAANGAFSYDPNGAYDHLGSTQSDSDSFTYQVSDGQGGVSTATAIITIQGVDGDVEITGLTDGTVTGTDGSVSDSNLTAGASGTFVLDAEDGVKQVSIRGSVFTLAELEAATATTPITVEGTNGDLVITDFTTSTGTVNYTFTLDQAADHTNGDVTEDFAIILTDVDDQSTADDTASATLSFAIIDAAPSAEDDADEAVNVAGGASSVAYGNVVTGANAGVDDGTDANATDGSADAIGADANASPVTGVGATSALLGTVGSDVTGDYGTLIINADGAYSYTPDYANTSVAALTGTGILTDTFTYQITDGDGTTATATLIMTLYSAPEIDDLTDGTVSGTDASVSEADLSTGSNASGTGEAVSSTFSIDTVKDLDKITVGGTEITTTELAASGTTPVDITTSKGTLSINGYDATSGAVSYTYTLSGNVTHTDGAPVSDDFTITVTDVLGDATTADLKIAIIDDTVSAGVDTGVVTEDATADVTGSVTTNDTIGADTNGSPVTGVIAGTVGAPTGNVDTAVSGTYGSLTLEANGNYTYTLDNSKPAVQALAEGVKVNDVFTYKITDGDGSSVTQTLTIEVTGINDAPVAVNDTASVNADATATGNVLTGSGVDTDVDGDVLTVTQINGVAYSTGTAITLTSGATLTMAANGAFSYDPNGAYDHLGSTQSDSDSFTYQVSDGQGGVSTATAIITIQGVDGDVEITGLTDGTVTGTDGSVSDSNLTAGASGTFVLDAEDGVKQVSIRGSIFTLAELEAATATTPITVEGTNGDLVITGFTTSTGTVNYTFTLDQAADHTNGDVTEDFAIILTDVDDQSTADDTASATLSFAIIDAAPSAEDDSDEAVNVAGGASSVAYGNVVTGANAGVDDGTDANATDGSADAIGADANASPVTGVGATSALLGTVGSDVTGDYGTLIINADGAYSYTPDYANTSVAGLTGTGILTDTFTYQITDGDGTTATATLIMTLYSAPEIDDLTDGTVSGTDASVSEADLSTGSNASGTGEAVSSTFSIDTVKDLDKITVGGTEITTTELAASGTTPVDITTSKGTLSINGYDATSGAVSYTYTLSGNVTHTDGAPVSDDFTITVTDVLGDATTADLKIAIIDDTVSAGVDTGVVTEDATADVTGSVTTNDTIGADTNGSPVTGVIAGTVGAPTGNVDTAVSGTYGSLTLEANGNYTYTLDNSKTAVQALAAGATANDVFTYKITDGDGSSVTQTLTIEVTGINDAPVAVNDTASVNADATATGNVLTGSGVDTDVDGDVLTVTQINGATYSTGTAITLTSGATLTMAANGAFSYDPNGAYDHLGSTQSDSDSFTYQVSDGQGGVSTATAIITIQGVDGDVEITGLTDGTVTGTDGSVSDSNLTAGASGTFVLDAEDGVKQVSIRGSIFTLAELEAATATTPITVEGTNGDLVITGFTTSTGTVNYTFTLDQAADHTNGDVTEDFAIILTDVDDQSTADDTASATLSFAIIDAAPSAEDDADEAVNVAGGASSVAYGNVVTGANAGVDDGTDANATDGSADAIGADANASPVTGVGATSALLGTVGSDVTGDYGTLIINADGAYSYTPDYANTSVAALTGTGILTDTFTYQITDGDGTTATATLIMTLYSAPEIDDLTDGTVSGTDASVSEADLSTGSNASGTGEAVSSTFSIDTVKDLDKITVGGTEITTTELAASGTTPVDITTSKGTLSINGYDATSGAVSYTYTLSGNVTHTDGAPVSDDFTITVTDVLGDATTADLKIAIIDDTVSAGVDTGVVTEDATADVTGSVTTNDTIGADTNGSPVTGVIAGTVGAPTGNVDTAVSGTYGSLTLEANGNYTYTLDNSKPAVQALAKDATANDVFTYKITDGDGSSVTQTLTIEVTGINDAPVAVNDTASVNADATATGNVLTGSGVDTDVDGDVLTVTQINGVAYSTGTAITLTSGATLTMAANGAFSYDPNGAYDHLGSTQSDSDSFTYQVSDGQGGVSTATAIITIQGVDGDVEITGLTDGTVTGTDGSVSDSNLTAGASGTFVLDAEDGVKQVSIRGSIFTLAELEAATATTPITVEGTNGDLVITGFTTSTGTVNYTFTLDQAADHTNGDVTEDFAIILTDVDDQSTADDTASATLSFAIIDAAPSAEDDSDEAVNVAGGASSVAYGNVVTGANAGVDDGTDANATDGSADAIGADANASPVTGVGATSALLGTVGSDVTGDYGTLVINADGAYSYTPDYANTSVAGLTGTGILTDTFTYQITDGDGTTATATLIMTLYSAPEIDDLTDGTVSGTDASVSEADLSTGSNASGTGEAVSSTFSIDTVKDLDKITVGGTEITATELAASGTTPVDITTAKGTLSINGYDATSGAVSYTYTLSGNVTHTDGAPVSDDFTITVTDVLGDATTADLKIAIIDDTVSAGVDTGVVTEDATADVTGSVTTNDTIGADTNGSPVTGVIAGTVGAPTGNVDTAVSGTYGSLTLEANGNYTYTLDNSKTAVQALAAGATANDVFTYKITDGDGSSVTQTLTIEVTGINDAPVAVNDTASVNADATATGNVLTGSGVDTDVDGDVLTVTQINGATYSTGTAITLTSGATLTMAANGAFSYDPNGAYDHLGSTQSDSDSFTYQVSDGQGGVSTATAIITIQGVDGDVEITGLTDGTVTGTDGSVSDSNLTAGASGTFVLDAEDGVKQVSIRGSIFTLAELEAATATTPITVEGTNGDLVITGFTTSTGTVNYTFTLDQAADHTNGDVTEDFAIILTDVDDQSTADDTASATLSFAIIDAAPSAEDDSDEAVNVAGGASSVAYGNVVTGANAGVDDGTDANATDGSADAIGADTNASPVTGVGATSALLGTVGSDVTGDYGTLVINADGAYSYTPDYANTSVAGLTGTGILTDTFTYQITDGDGTTATATLIMTLYSAPEIDDLTDGTVSGTDASVSEADLSTGSNASGTGEAVSSTFSIDTVKDLDKITVGGTEITTTELAASGTTPVDITTSKGTLSINGYDATSGAVSYTYTLSGNVTHTDGAPVSDDFTITVTDVLGDAIDSDLKIAIVDDGPTAVADHDEVINITGQPSSVAYGNVVTASNVGAGGNTDVNTTDGVADTIGADSNANPVTAVGPGEDAPSGGVGSTINGSYGSLVLNADGSYSYVPDYNNAAVVALGPDDTLPDVFTYELTDGDGSTATSTLTITIFGTPAVTGVTDGTEADTDGQVLESDLSDGSNAAGTGESINGSFFVHTQNNDSKKLTSITVGDTTFTAAELVATSNNAVSVLTTLGSIAINGFDSSTGAVSYSYTLINSADHSSGAIVTDDISLSVTDAAGDTGHGILKIVILDDVASATADDDAVTEGATVSEVTGSVIANDTIGADEQQKPVIGVIEGTGTPTAAGVGTAIDGTYGSLTLEEDGDYTYVLDNSSSIVQALTATDTVSDVFTYEITDGDGDTVTQTLTIAVTGANSRPIAIDPATNEAYPGTVDAATGLPIHATSGAVIQPIGAQTVHDHAEITPINVGAVVADPDSNDTLTFAASGLPTGLSIDAATGIISGTVDAFASTGGPNSNGIYPATVTATDASGAAITLSFNFTSDNSAPVAADNAYTTNEDVTSVAIGNALTDNDATSGKDSDPDDDVLAVVPQTNTAGSDGGLFTITAAGDLTFNTNGDFDYLAVGEEATTTLSYTITDGKGATDTATVTVTVEGRNDAPAVIDPETGEPYPNAVDAATGLPIDSETQEVIQPISAQTGFDNATITSIDVAALLKDIDTSDTLTYSATGLPAGLTIDGTSGIISGTIDNSASQGGMNGVYSITVTASDGEGGVIKPSFTMTVSNPAPTAADDDFTASEDAVAVVVGNALTSTAGTDTDDDDLVVTAQTDVAGSDGGLFSIDAAGQVTFSGNNDFEALKEGETAITTLDYTISDGEGGTDTATVTVTVNGAYDRPYIIDPDTGKPYPGTVDPTTGLPFVPGTTDLIQPIDAQTSVDNAATSIDVGSHLPDGLTYSATGLPAGLTIDLSTGVISGTIDNSASQGGTDGVYTITVTATATDGEGGSITPSFTMTVTNPLPTAADDAFTASEDAVAVVVGNALTSTAGTDTDDDDLVVTAQTDVAGSNGGLFSIDAAGQVTFSGNRDFEGLSPGENETTSLTYTISDGEGGTDTATITVTVEGQFDRPPLINPETGEPYPGPFDPTTGLPIDTVTGNVIQPIAPQTGESGEITPIDAGALFGGQEGLEYTATGLPEGLTIDPVTGEISGEIGTDAHDGGPNGDGKYTVAVTVTNEEGVSTIMTFEYEVEPVRPILINPETGEPYPGPFDPTTGLPIDAATGEVIQPIAPQTGESGEITPIDAGSLFGGQEGLEYTATGLPEGLTIDPATGEISGEIGTDAHDGGPNGDGNHVVTVEVTSAEGATTTMTFEYEVEPVRPILINPETGEPYPGPFDPTTGLPIDAATGEVIQPIAPQTGESGEITPIDAGSLFGGQEGLEYTATGLPEGLTIDPATGEISGEIGTDAHDGGPNGDGKHVVTVEVTSAEGATTTMTFEYEVEPVRPILINPETGEPYPGPFDPTTGLPIDAATGNVIQPIAPQTGESGEITPIDAGALFGGQEGLEYTATGLPEGLTIDPATGEISGEIGTDAHDGGPNGDGNHVVTVEVTSAEGATTTMTFEYEVEPVRPILINPETGEPYPGPFDPSTGLPIDAVTGEVIQPIAPQTGESGEITPIDAGALFGGQEGLEYTATGLPEGLTIDPATGEISGEIGTDAHDGGPNGDGNHVVTVEVTSAEGATTTMTFEYEVEPVRPILINPETGEPYPGPFDPTTGLPIDAATGEVIQPIAPQTGESGEITPIDAGALFGGQEGLEYTATGLPEGLTIDPATGEISGEIGTDAHDGGPNGDGNHVVTVEVTSAEGATTTMTFEYEVEPVRPILINPETGEPYPGPFDPTTGLPIDAATGEVIQPIGPQIAESGNVTPIDVGSLFGGEEGLEFEASGLPDGLTIDPETGLISGTPGPNAYQGGPNGDGNYVVTVQVTSAEGVTTTITFEYEVEVIPTVVAPSIATPDISEQVQEAAEEVQEIAQKTQNLIGDVESGPNDYALNSVKNTVTSALFQISPLNVVPWIDPEGNVLSQTIQWIEKTMHALDSSETHSGGLLDSFNYVGGDISIPTSVTEFFQLRTMIHGDRLYVEAVGSDQPVQLIIESLDAQAHPNWIESVASNLQMINPPIGKEEISVVLVVKQENGDSIKVNARINLVRGGIEIEETIKSSAIQGLSEQLQTMNDEPVDKVRNLLKET